MKKTLTTLMAILVAGIAFAETDYVAMPRINRILKGEEDFTQLDVSDKITVDDIDEYTTGNGVDVDGLNVTDSGIDTTAAGTMTVGAATATKVEIADTGVQTEVQGDLEVQADIDTMAAGTMTIGSSAATKVELADSAVETEVQGTLDVLQAADFDGAITATNITLDAGATLDVGGNIVLENDEGIINDTDGDVEITYDDDAVVLSELRIVSANAATNIEDNNSQRIDFVAYDSATNEQEYVYLESIIVDATSASEDSALGVTVLSGGTAERHLYIGSGNTNGNGDVVEVNSQKASFRIGYPAAEGFDFATSGGGTELLIGTDYARTGSTERVSITTNAAGGQLSIDDKYGVTGPDETTGLMVQALAATIGAGGSVTDTFAVVFGAAPTITWTYNEDPGTNKNIWVTLPTASNCVINGAASKDVVGIAVGPRP